jgi:hypothetical protein
MHKTVRPTLPDSHETVSNNPGAVHFAMDTNSCLQVLSFLFEIHRLIIDPTQAMAGNFPIGFAHRRFRIAGQGHGHTIDRDRNCALREQSPQTPKAGSGSVFVNGLHAHVPHAGQGLRANNSGKKGF